MLPVGMGALLEEDCKYFDEESSGDFGKYQPIPKVSSHGPQSGGTRRTCWFPRGVVRHLRGYVRTCFSHRFVLVLTLYLEHSPEGQ